MLHCWHESPSDRPSFRELVNKFDKILQSAANKVTWFDIIRNSRPRQGENYFILHIFVFN